MLCLKRARLLFQVSSRLTRYPTNSSHSHRVLSPSVKQRSNLNRNENNIPKWYCSIADAKPDEVMPKHIAVILDGNGRWAKSRGLEVKDGHRAGCVALKNLISNCAHLGIKVLTVFAFSVDNWKRSKMEVDQVMQYIESCVRSDVTELMERHNIRFTVIGNKSELPESLQSTITSVEAAGQSNRGMHFVMAINYAGRNEIAMACKKIAMLVQEGVLEAKDVDEKEVEKRMMTNFTEFPNPDLLIRTSGELRVSNFLLWQSAYSEFYFADKMFPDFGKADLLEALASFQQRQRRYGERKN